MLSAKPTCDSPFFAVCWKTGNVVPSGLDEWRVISCHRTSVAADKRAKDGAFVVPVSYQVRPGQNISEHCEVSEPRASR
jgi:hypothetical protein